MIKVRAKNLRSNNGNAVPNQFVIDIMDEKGNYREYFQSYTSVIAMIDENGKHYLDKSKWDYSVTTGKYRNKFLGETKKETEKNIKDGTYTLTNLN